MVFLLGQGVKSHALISLFTSNHCYHFFFKINIYISCYEHIHVKIYLLLQLIWTVVLSTVQVVALLPLATLSAEQAVQIKGN